MQEKYKITVADMVSTTVMDLVRKRDTEVRAIPRNTLKTLHFYGMDARVSQ